MRTQSKNRLFGILIALVLIACVFLTMTPIALADEPQPEVVPISEPIPVLYDDEAEPEVMPISEPIPVLYDDELEVEAISVDEPEPVLISEQPTAQVKSLPTWGWVMIMVGIAVLSALVTFIIFKHKSKKAKS